MSDPMTNMEIEDVLSSIRRLVSEDLRPAPRDSAAAPRAAEHEGKLVLTPAFRIADPAPVKLEVPPVWRRAASRYRTESAETGDMDTDAGTDVPAEDAGGWAGDGPLHLTADLALDGFAGDIVETDLADGQDEAAVPPETVLMEQQATQSTPDGEDFGSEDAPAAETSTDSATDSATLEAAIAELEAAVAASDEDWEPDGSEMTSRDHFVLPSMRAGRVMAEAAEAFGLHQNSEEPGLRRLHLQPGTYHGDPSEPVLAEPIWAEPVWADPAPGPAKRQTPSLAETDQAAASMFAGDETLLDEGMLRELVIEVIRQELQGALGERITRNVRKLVRAEIHRALAGREFG